MSTKVCVKAFCRSVKRRCFLYFEGRTDSSERIFFLKYTIKAETAGESCGYVGMENGTAPIKSAASVYISGKDFASISGG